MPAPLAALGGAIIKGGAMALKGGAMVAKTGGKLAIKGGKIAAKGAKGAAKGAARASVAGGPVGGGNDNRPTKISKEPIWSSGTTKGGEYLSSGDRKAIFRQSRRKIDSSSSLIPTSSAIVPSTGDKISPTSSAIVPSTGDKISPTLSDIVPSAGGKISTEVMDFKTLESRVAANEKNIINNEKKITMLKRILKTHQNPFGGGPLEEVNRILEDIGNALALDFGNRITQKENEIADLKASAESKKRGGIESGLEAVNKISTKVNNAFGVVLSPAKGILDKIMGFFGNLAAGFLADKALTWLSNNQEAVTGFFKFLQDHGKKILIGLGVLIGGTIAVKLVKKVIGVVKFIGGVIKAVKGAFKLAQSIFKYKNIGKIAKRAGIALLGKGGMKAVTGVGKSILGGVKNIGKGVMSAGKTGVTGAKNAVKATKAITKTGGKGLLKGLGKFGGKGFLKKIPIVGLGMGAAFAAGRLLSNPPDWMGAALELGSGAASMIPGVGTAVSLALDAGTMVRDHKKGQNAQGDEQQAEISGIESDYAKVVDTATSMDFGKSVKSKNLQAPAKGGVEIMETIKQSDIINQGGQSGGGEDSLPSTPAADISNSEISFAMEQLGIYV